MNKVHPLLPLTGLVMMVIYINPSWAQTTENNYVKSYKALVPIAGTIDGVSDKDSVIQTTSYYDGLGRELQSVGRQASPLGFDVVTFPTYDKYGRKTKTYLPFASHEQNGALKDDPQSAQQHFYGLTYQSADSSAAFSEVVLEASELARPVKQGAPGGAWQVDAHAVKKEYLTNGNSDVLLFTYDSAASTLATAADPPNPAAFYPANELSCVKTIDEEQNDVLVYTDRLGRTICKKVKAPGGVYASTYYIYDDFGSLVVVLPPEAVERIVSGN